MEFNRPNLDPSSCTSANNSSYSSVSITSSRIIILSNTSTDVCRCVHDDEQMVGGGEDEDEDADADDEEVEE